MAKMLSQAEKYINDFEGLLSKWENSSAQKKKSKGRKSENEAPGDEEMGIDPPEWIEGIKSGLQRDEATLGTSWAYLSLSCNNDIHPSNSPP